MINIKEILTTVPESFRKRFIGLHAIMDHPIYHPEGTTGKHVKIVLNRVVKSTKDIDMVFVALLHDICKADKGAIKLIPKDKFPDRLPEGGQYWQNIFHAEQACDLIENDQEIRKWINDHGGNFDRIHTIIGQHMKIKSFIKGIEGKSGGMKPKKIYKYLEKHNMYINDFIQFLKYDSMLNKEFRKIDKDISDTEKIILDTLNI